MQEDYSTWSIEKFRRLCERFMESSHMTGSKDAYKVLHAELQIMLKQFEALHPKAFKNWKISLKDR